MGEVLRKSCLLGPRDTMDNDDGRGHNGEALPSRLTEEGPSSAGNQSTLDCPPPASCVRRVWWYCNNCHCRLEVNRCHFQPGTGHLESPPMEGIPPKLTTLRCSAAESQRLAVSQWPTGLNSSCLQDPTILELIAKHLDALTSGTSHDCPCFNNEVIKTSTETFGGTRPAS